jgi:hypothetical protein
LAHQHPLDKELFGTPEQRVFLARARAFVRFSATQRASLIGLQEWKARGPAAMLAADLGAPVLDPQALQVLTAEDALAALPDTTSTIPASISDGITIGLEFKPWVRVDDAEYLGMIAVMTDGMRRFGLPELRMGPASPDLREELTTLAGGLACIDLEDEVSYGREGEVRAVAEDGVASTGKRHHAGGLRRQLAG